MHLERYCITSSSCEELLEITKDSVLKFAKHISDLCDKFSKKIYTLCQFGGYFSVDKRKIVMQTFLKSQLNYYPLIWMLHSRALNNKSNRLHRKENLGISSSKYRKYYKMET